MTWDDGLRLDGDRADLSQALTLLGEIERDGEYYIPLSLHAEDPTSVLLRRLARDEYIRWCPYPEEFYIILPKGRELLDMHRQ